MPIRIPNDLPATRTLQNENIFVMTETRAMTQDIRPLNLLLLNLMPTKIDTETQLARLLGNTPLQVNMELMCMSTHESKNTAQDHLLTFYKTFDQIRDRKFDGMIITGAPVEQLAFEDVDYWPELCDILEWTNTNVHSTFHICWGAQAALYYHYGIRKYPLEEKLFGVFQHTVDYRRSILFRGFDDMFMAPTPVTPPSGGGRGTHPSLKILASSKEAGVYVVSSRRGRRIFVMGHSEYDAGTLDKEYRRDKDAGLPIRPPVNYFPDDDDTKTPIVSWRSHANLLYSNWLNYFVYQTTPYDLKNMQTETD